MATLDRVFSDAVAYLRANVTAAGGVGAITADAFRAMLQAGRQSILDGISRNPQVDIQTSTACIDALTNSDFPATMRQDALRPKRPSSSPSSSHRSPHPR